jgi:hypothetical protein
MIVGVMFAANVCVVFVRAVVRCNRKRKRASDGEFCNLFGDEVSYSADAALIPFRRKCFKFPADCRQPKRNPPNSTMKFRIWRTSIP